MIGIVVPQAEHLHAHSQQQPARPRRRKQLRELTSHDLARAVVSPCADHHRQDYHLSVYQDRFCDLDPSAVRRPSISLSRCEYQRRYAGPCLIAVRFMSVVSQSSLAPTSKADGHVSVVGIRTNITLQPIARGHIGFPDRAPHKKRSRRFPSDFPHGPAALRCGSLCQRLLSKGG